MSDLGFIVSVVADVITGLLPSPNATNKQPDHQQIVARCETLDSEERRARYAGVTNTPIARIDCENGQYWLWLRDTYK